MRLAFKVVLLFIGSCAFHLANGQDPVIQFRLKGIVWLSHDIQDKYYCRVGANGSFKFEKEDVLCSDDFYNGLEFNKYMNYDDVVKLNHIPSTFTGDFSIVVDYNYIDFIPIGVKIINGIINPFKNEFSFEKEEYTGSPLVNSSAFVNINCSETEVLQPSAPTVINGSYDPYCFDGVSPMRVETGYRDPSFTYTWWYYSDTNSTKKKILEEKTQNYFCDIPANILKQNINNKMYIGFTVYSSHPSINGLYSEVSKEKLRKVEIQEQTAVGVEKIMPCFSASGNLSKYQVSFKINCDPSLVEGHLFKLNDPTAIIQISRSNVDYFNKNDLDGIAINGEVGYIVKPGQMCYKEGKFTIPSFGNKMFEIVNETGNNTYYFCPNTPRVIKLKLNKGVSVSCTSATFSASDNTSSNTMKEVDCTLTKDGGIDFIFTGLGEDGRVVSVPKSIKVVFVPSLSTSQKVDKQICHDGPNGGYSLELTDGWWVDAPSLTSIADGKAVAFSNTSGNFKVQGLVSGGYKLAFARYKHGDSGCELNNPTDVVFNVESSFPAIDISLNGGAETQFGLGCVGASRLITVSHTNAGERVDGLVSLFEGNDVVESSFPKGSYKAIVKYRTGSCKDTWIKPFNVINPIDIEVSTPNITYTSDEAKTQISFGLKNYEAYRYELYNAGNIKVDSKDMLTSQIVSAVPYGVYRAVFTRKNCGGVENQHTVEGITVYGRPQIELQNKVDVAQCSGKIIPSFGAKNQGSGQYWWKVRKSSNPDFTVYKPTDDNFSVGKYYIKLEDVKTGFESNILEVTVGAESPIVLDKSIEKINVPCHNGEAIIPIKVSSGTVQNKYSLNGGPMTDLVPNSPILYSLANYEKSEKDITVKVTDDLGCSDTHSYKLVNPASVGVEVQSEDLEYRCMKPASVVLKASGGVGGYKFYSKTDNSTVSVMYGSGGITNLTPENYQFWVEDGNGCKSSSVLKTVVSENINIKLDVQKTNGRVTNSLSPNGVIGVVVEKGVKPYTFSLNGEVKGVSNSESFLFQNLKPGNYKISVTGNDKCGVTLDYSVKEPFENLKVGTAPHGASCFSAKNGSVDVSLAGRESNMELASIEMTHLTKKYTTRCDVSDGKNSYSIEGLEAGQYSLVVKNKQGEAKEPTIVEILEPTEVNLSINPVNPVYETMENGVLKVNEQPVTFKINPGENKISKVLYRHEGELGWKDAFFDVDKGIYKFYATKGGTFHIRIEKCESSQPYEQSLGVAYVPLMSYEVEIIHPRGGAKGTLKIINKAKVEGASYRYLLTLIKKGDESNPKELEMDPSKLYEVFDNVESGSYRLLASSIVNGKTLGVGAEKSSIVVNPSLSAAIKDIGKNEFLSIYLKCSGDALTGKELIDNLQVEGGVRPYSFYTTSNAEVGNYALLEDATSLKASSYWVKVVDKEGTELKLGQYIRLSEPVIPLALEIPEGTQQRMLCSGKPLAVQVLVKGGWGGYQNLIIDNLPIAGYTGGSQYIIKDVRKGSHTISIEDIKGCKVPLSYEVDEPKEVSLLLDEDTSVLDMKCTEEPKGKVTLKIEGGTSDNGKYYISYKSKNGEVSCNNMTTIENLAIGNYIFTASDKNSCLSKPLEVSVTTSSFRMPETFKVVSSNADCFGTMTGKVVLDGKVEGLQYSLTGSNSTAYTLSGNEFGGLKSDVYTLTILNGKCSIKHPNIIIGEPLALTLDTLTTPECKLNGNGVLKVTAEGGVAPYKANFMEITIKDFSRVAEFAKLGAVASSKLVVTDANGCRKEQDVKVYRLKEVALEPVVDAACRENTGGAITASFTPNTRSVSWHLAKKEDGSWFEFNDIGFGNSFSKGGLKPNTYKLRLIDESTQCLLGEKDNIEVNPSVKIDKITVKPVKCKGEKSAIEVSFVNTGNKNQIEYYIKRLEEPDDSYRRFDLHKDLLPADRYTLQARTHYCADSKDFEVVEPKLALRIHAAPTVIKDLDKHYHIRCHGEATGIVTLTTEGGWGGYQYRIKGAEKWGSTPVFDKLSAGSYIFEVADEKQCVMVSPEITLNQAADEPRILLDRKEQKQNSEVTENLLVVKGVGGYAPYSFVLNNVENTPRKPISANTPVEYRFSKTGDFRATMTDMLGCEANSTYTFEGVGSGIRFEKNAVNPTCFGGNDGRITIVNPQGEYTYRLKRNGQVIPFKNMVFEGLSKGLYDMEVTSGEFSYYTSVEISDPLPIAIKGSVDPTCFNSNSGRITVKPTNLTGDNLYTVNLYRNGERVEKKNMVNEPVMFEKYGAGNYKVVVENTKQYCASSDMAQSDNLEIKTLAPLNYVLDVQHPCVNNRAEVKGQFAVGERSFHLDLENKSLQDGGWNNTTRVEVGGNVSNVAIPVDPGLYRFRMEDTKYGCTDYTNEVKILTMPKITKAIVKDEVCFGTKGSLEAAAEGGSGQLSLYVGVKDYFSLFKDKVELSPDAYKLKLVDDETGCSLMYSGDLIVDGAKEPLRLEFHPSVYAGGFNIACSGSKTGNLQVKTLGGGANVTFEYNGISTSLRDNQFDALGAGAYKFKVTDSFGCVVTDQVELKEPTPLKLGILASNLDLGCTNASDGFVELQVDGGVAPFKFANTNDTYGEGGVFKGLGTGDYLLKVKDANGCLASTSATVTSKYIPIDVTLNARDVSCFGKNDGSISIVNKTGVAYTYKWNESGSSSSEMPGLLPGVYGVVVSTPKGCSKDFFTTIKEPSKLLFSINWKDACPGESSGLVTFDAQGGIMPYSFYLNERPFENISLAQAAPTGDYLAKVVDANGCQASSSVSIKQKAGTISTNFLVVTSSKVADKLVLVDLCNPKPDKIEWDLSNGGIPINQVGEENGMPLVTFKDEGAYQIVMKAHYGDCLYTVAKTIEVKNGVLNDGSQKIVLGATGIKNFLVYPNPSDGYSKYRLELYEPKGATIFIYNILGVLVRQIRVKGADYYEGDLVFEKRGDSMYIVKVVPDGLNEYREVKVVVR
ncbi:SprB repeat-containing protein [Alistipes sp. ZOR0009]|uniref:SprB repeat-containing protein n=1 Tax=Alistipes sp. ZOR0009 TaxID=1339253 RepID=UPI0006489635|nr:SprB repeat-containing protein [Alistipes sp. ZOR0009]